MIARLITSDLHVRLTEALAVALLGPRQVGKTTLAGEIGDRRPSIYLDLQQAADRAKLAEPELYLARHDHKPVTLDEVHPMPGLFQSLRGLIESGRRKGLRIGRFLRLGSASIDLLRQSGESLAGRIAYREIGPLSASELGHDQVERLWIRDAVPDSFLSARDCQSQRWWQDFIRRSLERDIPMLGPHIAAETLRRF